MRIGGQRIEAIRIDIEQVQVPPASRAQISFFILLEMQRIDHDGFWRAAGFARYHREYQALAVRRPGIYADVARDAGQLAGIAAAAVQQHDLRLLRTGRRSHERQVTSVRAPAWFVRALSRRGQGEMLAAVPTHHPDCAARLVGPTVVAGHDVGHPRAVGRHLRVAHVLNPVKVIGHQCSVRGRRGSDGPNGAYRQQQTRESCSQMHRIHPWFFSGPPDHVLPDRRLSIER